MVRTLGQSTLADELGVVQRFYSLAGVEMTVDARKQLERYLGSNPRGKHGQVVYDLVGDFGITPAEVRERFGFYFERFPVRAES